MSAGLRATVRMSSRPGVSVNSDQWTVFSFAVQLQTAHMVPAFSLPLSSQCAELTLPLAARTTDHCSLTTDNCY
jgi:hypothetical protein